METQSNRVHWSLKVAFAVTLLIHLWAATLPFFMDDFAYIETVRNLSLADVPDLFTAGNLDQSASGVWWTPGGMLPFFRPIAILSFAVDWQIWGLNALGYHLTNIILHVLCSWLAYRLALRLTKDAATAGVAALVFAIHPVHSEAVVWMSGRFDLLVCAVGTSAILAYLRWRDSRRIGWAVATVLLYVVSLGCKETGIVVPAFWFLLAVFWRGGRAERSKVGEWLIGLSFSVIGVGYIVLRFALFGGLGKLPPPYGVDLSTTEGFVSLFRNLAQYTLDFVLMVQADAVMMNDFWTRHPWWLVGGVTIAIAVVVMMVRAHRFKAALLLGLAWTAIFTAPTLPAMVGERNVYFAAVGVALVIGPAMVRWLSVDRTRKIAMAAIGWAVALSAGEHYLLWRTNTSAQQVYRDLQTHLPDPPPNTRIYVVNQNPFVAIGFSTATRILYGREDISAMALTLSREVTAGTQDHAERIGSSTIRVTREGDHFFSGFFERLMLFGNQPDILPEAAGRVDLNVSFDWNNYNNADAITFELPALIDSESIRLFHWNNSEVKTIFDALWSASWPRLEPLTFPPASSDAD